MKIRTTFLIIFPIIVALGISAYFLWLHFKSLTTFPMQPVTFDTTDGVTIAGDYAAPKTPIGAVLLLPMMPATKESWYNLQQALGRAHIASLAIDLRGHGQSTQGPAGIRLDYHTFTDTEHQLTKNDVTAGIEFLTNHSFTKNHISIIGASIGANFAIQQLAQDPEINSAVLLSPGLDFHGIETEQYSRSLSQNQALYTIASRDDQYSFDSSRTLFNATTVKKDIGEYDTIGHGTAMLENNPELMDAITQWIIARFQ